MKSSWAASVTESRVFMGVVGGGRKNWVIFGKDVRDVRAYVKGKKKESF